MLSSVTNFIFGSSEPQADSDTTKDVDLKTKSTDEGWLLVDFPDVLTSEANGDVPVACSKPGNNSSNSSSPGITSTPESLSPPRFCHSSLRKCIGPTESWIVTPPPCFTAGGKNSSPVEVHPLENLLIEHPSMSVYEQNTSQRRTGSTGEESNESDSSGGDDDEDLEAMRTLSHQVRQAPRRSRALTMRASTLAQAEKMHASQRVQHKYNTRNFSKNQLSRVNEVKRHNDRPKHIRLHQPYGRKSSSASQRRH